MEYYQELGLTKNESKVYETLIHFGKLGAGEISQHSQVSYGKIYNVLNSLIAKGLVHIIPEKNKKFMPSNPQILVNLIEKKEEELKKIKEKTQEMKQFYNIKEKNPVVMEMGKKGFYKIVSEKRNIEKYNYNIKWTSEIKPEWVNEVKQKLRKKIDMKSLVRYDEETKKNVDKWLKVNKNIRKFNNEGITLSIIDDEEVIIGLIKNNIALSIKDKHFTKIMKHLYSAAYEKAEKI